MPRKRMNRVCSITDERNPSLHRFGHPHQPQRKRRARRKQRERPEPMRARFGHMRAERSVVQREERIGDLIRCRPDDGHRVPCKR